MNALSIFSGRWGGWYLALVIAFLSAAPVVYFSISYPRLIVIPIFVGAILVVALDVIKIATPKPYVETTAEDPHRSFMPYAPKLPTPYFSPVEVLGEDSYLDLTSTLAVSHRLVFTGDMGVGKTTMAKGLCWEFEKLNGSSPVKQVPIFVSYPESRRTSVSELLFNGVSERIENSQRNGARKQAKRMANAGNLLFVLDDCERMGMDADRQFKKFVTSWPNNVFICITKQIAENSCLNAFREVKLSGWSSTTVMAYIRKSIDDPEISEGLIKSLDQLELLKNSMQASDAQYVVEKCLEGTYFKLLFLGKTAKEEEYEILSNYLRIAMKENDAAILGNHLSVAMKDTEAQFGPGGRTREFGRLALKLMKEDRVEFSPHDEQIEIQHLNEMMPNVFKPARDKNVAFTHPRYQVILAAKYIANFWSEAQAALMDEGARKLAWKAVYNCAIVFSHNNTKQIEEIEKAFRHLSMPRAKQLQ